MSLPSLVFAAHIELNIVNESGESVESKGLSSLSGLCDLAPLLDSIDSLNSIDSKDWQLTKRQTLFKLEVLGRSSNGRTAVSGSAYRGSNPCLPAIIFEMLLRRGTIRAFYLLRWRKFFPNKNGTKFICACVMPKRTRWAWSITPTIWSGLRSAAPNTAAPKGSPIAIW